MWRTSAEPLGSIGARVFFPHLQVPDGSSNAKAVQECWPVLIRHIELHSMIEFADRFTTPPRKSTVAEVLLNRADWAQGSSAHSRIKAAAEVLLLGSAKGIILESVLVFLSSKIRSIISTEYSVLYFRQKTRQMGFEVARPFSSIKIRRSMFSDHGKTHRSTDFEALKLWNSCWVL